MTCAFRKLLFLFPFIFFSNYNYLASASNYTCETPPNWFPGFNISTVSSDNPNFSSVFSGDTSFKIAYTESNDGVKWPDGIVYYHMDPTHPLKSSQIEALKQAFQEFETKTCLKFQPTSSTNTTNSVSIRRWNPDDSRKCGRATVCMRNNSFLEVAEWCSSKASFVHELGHVVCLTHEFWRPDRDQFVSFENCPAPEIISTSVNHGIYDYASQMHYPCSCAGGGGVVKNPEWKFCGEEIPGNDGLSIMDADTINELYNCQGCQRHRWRPITSLTQEDTQNMYSFGHVDSQGRPIFPCRALHKGEVAVGAYTRETQTCVIPSRFEGRGQEVVDQAEVLTIPGGLSADSGEDHSSPLFQYELVNILAESRDVILRTAVPAGNGWRLVGENFDKNYVAFASLTWQDWNMRQERDFEVAVDQIGTVYAFERGDQMDAVFTTGTNGLVRGGTDYNVLVCR